MNWKVMGAIIVFSIPLIISMALLFNMATDYENNPNELPEALTGKQAPEFSLDSIEGYKIALKDLKGSVAVVNFWATWCQPCMQEHKDLIEVSSQYKSKGVAFLGVLYNDEKAKAKPFLSKHGSAYPTLLDGNQRTALDYGVAGVPETFVIDQQGVIVKKFIGPIDKMEMTKVLDGLVK